MIDVHCHILPGVDDGPRSMQESLDIARISVDNGITHAIATPHFLAITRKSTWEKIHTILSKLQDELKQHSIPLQVRLAAEVRVCGELINHVMASDVPFIGSIHGKPVVLLEFPHTTNLPLGSDKLMSWLINQDIVPLIAHPERNKTFQRDSQMLMPYIRMGCMLQITSGSFIGKFGLDAQRTARNLLDEGYVSVVATDAHDANLRPPDMTAGYDYIVHHAGEVVARKLTEENPAAITGIQ